MKKIFIIASLILVTQVFAQEENETTTAPGFTGTNIMGSGSKSAEGPAISSDDTKYQNMDQQKMEEFKKEDSTTTNAIKGKTSIKVE